MKDDLEQLLRSLHLRKIAEFFDGKPSAPTRPTSRTKSSRRAFSARSGKPIRSPAVNARQIHTFPELEFVHKAENIVFVGANWRR